MDIEDLNKTLTDQKPEQILQYFVKEYPNQVVFSSSLGAEDQVITDMICSCELNIDIFTLDTGRLNKETYTTYDKTTNKYNKTIKIYFPDEKDIQQMVERKGFFSFYESIENRKECCFVRKVKPLQRALSGYKIWITGLRSSQAPTRSDLKIVEFDDNNKIIKVNPLLHWSEKEVWDYIKKNEVPYNKLHDKGYPSIGCEPCTRAIKDGEDLRSGRWWWEDADKKECGLHK